MAITLNGTTGITNTGDYDAEDNDKILLGTGDDLEIYHDGSNSYINDTGTGLLIIKSNQLQIKNDAADEKMIVADANGAVELYYDNSKKVETVSTGVQFHEDFRCTNNAGSNTAALQWYKGGDALFFIDDIKAKFGNGGDLEIYHNGSHSYINDTGTGQLIIKGDLVKLQATNGEDYLQGHENGAVNLYYNGSKKLATDDGGATVSGNLTVYSGGSSQIHFYDVDTRTIRIYTSSTALRWFDDVNDDAIAEIQQDGDMVIDGSYSTSGVDYAEYFESTDGSAIPVGTTVVLDNGKVRAATGSETPIGVVRPKTNGTSITGGLNELKWQGKYLTDDYDDAVLEDATFCTWKEGEEPKQAWKDSGETIPADATETSMKRRKLNPDFDKSKTYVPRSQRAEWNCVGLLGQIPITKGQPTSTNWIKMKDRSSTVELWMVK